MLFESMFFSPDVLKTWTNHYHLLIQASSQLSFTSQSISDTRRSRRFTPAHFFQAHSNTDDALKHNVKTNLLEKHLLRFRGHTKKTKEILTIVSYVLRVLFERR